MEQSVAVLDGGLASELERRGYLLDDELWSAWALLEAPNAVVEIHLDYLRAGADVITSATYQATFEGLARRGLRLEEARSVMGSGVELALRARDTFWATPANRVGRARPLVAASVGSYGAYLADGSEYRGDYGLSIRDLMDFHRARLALLARSGADVLAIETVPCRAEAVAVSRLLEDLPAAGAWIAFCCRDAGHAASGEPLSYCVSAVDDKRGVLAVGVNCTAPMFVEPLLRAAAAATSKPLVAYPNAGEAWDPATRSWAGGGSPDPLGDAAMWVAAGARLVGGCCRTTPDDIRRLRSSLSLLGEARP